MEAGPVHPVYRPKGALARAEARTSPPPLPEPVLAALRSAPLPALLFRLPVLRESARAAAAFPGFLFPAKCNPHPRVLAAVLEAGGGLSVRNFSELKLALSLGARPERVCFTGWGLGEALMERLIRAGVTVNLDSAREVRVWAERFPRAPFGVRLMAGDDPEYLSAGFAHGEVGPMLEGVRRAGAALSGVMVHWPHQVGTAEGLAEEYAPLPRLLRNTLGDFLPRLAYLNLGGGWPASYGQGEELTPAEVAEALSSRLLPALRAVGFEGEMVVEPGRAVAASCGHWAARILSVGSGPAGPDPLQVVLDTPCPTPPYRLPYPVHLLRDGEEVRTKPDTLCALSAIQPPTLLPPPCPGDTLVFDQAGAYLATNWLLDSGEPPPRIVLQD